MLVKILSITFSLSRLTQKENLDLETALETASAVQKKKKKI